MAEDMINFHTTSSLYLVSISVGEYVILYMLHIASLILTLLGWILPGCQVNPLRYDQNEFSHVTKAKGKLS